MLLNKVDYTKLKGKAQENYNFAKVSSALADYGYSCIRLTDDYQGADFIAVHAINEDSLMVQLKGRWSIFKKYLGKNIKIAFRDGDDIYIYDHDDMVKACETLGLYVTSNAWIEGDGYDKGSLPKKLLPYMTKL
jgi:hypothetical protein